MAVLIKLIYLLYISCFSFNTNIIYFCFQYDLVDEITASFRRFGHLFVDWPHKAESKSYFPPKGKVFKPLNINKKKTLKYKYVQLISFLSLSPQVMHSSFSKMRALCKL